MTTQAQKTTFTFETEIKRLLHLVVHSLYSNKEIFLRELISNASDAADRLRFEALSDAALFENDSDLKIKVEFDEKAKTITVSDNGIGMSRDEVIAHLGTIAKSGTQDFLAALSGDQAKDAKLIGQFGVGFYSAFIVADKVTVRTRRAGLTKEHGVVWESAGEGAYDVFNIEKEARGTEIILHIKDEEKEFLNDWQLQNIIRKYSDHIALPILMKKISTDEKKKETVEWEQINRGSALWTLPKNQIKEAEYHELYKHIAHDFENPLAFAHHRVEGKLEYTSLLYIPAHAPFDLWQREQHRGLKLYINRVFIMDEAEQFLPNYLRFVKGIVDCHDLPLNVSREILQHNPLVEKIRASLIKRVLKLLSELAKDQADIYAKFWTEFGKVIKEGPSEDMENREAIAELFRFASTHTDADAQTVSLLNYMDRMKPGQKQIYYITAENFLAAKHSPHLEVFREKGIEVLLLSDRVDEWWLMHLPEFKGKAFQSIAKGDLDLSEVTGEAKPSEKEEAREKEEATEFESTLKRMKEVLGDKVKEVRLTHRLTTSPACIVVDSQEMNVQMQRLMKAMGQAMPASAPILELNPKHALIQKMQAETDEDRFKLWADVLLGQAFLAEGTPLEDSALFVKAMNQLLS